MTPGPRKSPVKTGPQEQRHRSWADGAGFALAALLLVTTRLGLAWGPEGHKAVALLAERYLRPQTRAQVHELLGSESLEDASLWADQIAHTSRPETAPWHYIDIPLRDSRIDMRADCPQGQCVLAKTQEFVAVLGNPQAGREARSEALKFVVHFVADLHQPLHCEDHHDKGGNTQAVIFEGHPDNLHWVWDTGLVEEINRDPHALAVELGRETTEVERAGWQTGSIESWVLESHRLAQTAAYRRSWAFGTPVLGRDYDERAEAVVKLQLEKAAVRLALLLNRQLP
jgi:S1/P1 Nuclease